MNKKQEKLAVRGLGLAENREKQSSEASDEEKTRKISCPRSRMNKKQGKLAFPHGGKSKFSENRLSLMRENKKTAKNGFPLRGKTK